MKKAAGGLTLTTLVLLVVGFLAVLAIASLFFGDQMNDLVENRLSNMFDLDMDDETRTAHQTRQQSFEDFSSFLEQLRMLESNQEQNYCFATFTQIPAAFFSNQEIEITRKGDSQMEVRLFENYEGESLQGTQVTRRPLIPAQTVNLTPCLIQGSNLNILEFFYDYYVEPEEIERLYRLGKPVDQIVLTGRDKIEVVENNQQKQFDFHTNDPSRADHLYIKKVGGSACFIPTRLRNLWNMVGNCNKHDEILTYSCLDADQSKSLKRNLINNESYVCNGFSLS